MDYSDVLKYQDDLVKKYKYKPIPPMFREDVLRFYKDNLPEHFCLDGDNCPLFTKEGLLLCHKYNRIVIGDYGAFVEVLPEDMVTENIKVKDGEEYRDFDERYSKRTKYSWLTAKDSSDVKIYFQKKTVDYADYVPGRYYFSPYECDFSKVIDRDLSLVVSKDKIAHWLREQGVFTNEVLDYYLDLSKHYGNELRVVIEQDMFPGDFEYWVKLNEVCGLENGLSFEQFQYVKYNLSVIDCKLNELNGCLSCLNEAIKTAIQMGLDGVELPYSVQELSVPEIRSLLSLSATDLLDVMHFCKIVAGCKSDGMVHDVESLINEAEKREQSGFKKELNAEMVL